MKKSITLIITSLILILSLCGCSAKNDINLTFEKDGTVIAQMSADEFLSKHSETYDGCIVSGTGEITYIQPVGLNSWNQYGEQDMGYEITINKVIVLVVNDDSYIACNVGDTITFEQEYDRCEGQLIYLWNNKPFAPDHYYDISN